MIDMKRTAILIISVLMVLCLLCGCQMDEFGTYNDFAAKEWVSPDGVHYWYITAGSAFGITPRYDNSGNLVIDN